MHKKPTNLYGSWTFSPEGKVTQNIDMLPQNKEQQEEAVIEKFIQKFNSLPEPPITNFKALPENDHDFEIELENSKIYVQITEIIEREYLVSKIAPMSPNTKEGIIRFRPGTPTSQEIDIHRKYKSLKVAIQRKIEKLYSKLTSDLWLLVFTTDSSFDPNYSDTEFEPLPSPKEVATNYLKETECVFDRIWFLGISVHSDNLTEIWNNKKRQ